jgi:hypothetical protein
MTLRQILREPELDRDLRLGTTVLASEVPHLRTL